MSVFITGTDTDIGKTLVSSWLCLHSGFSYFKPIQSGSLNETDSEIVARLSGATIHPEIYRLKEPLSPHQAANIDLVEIDLLNIKLPVKERMIVEGAGGLMVPLNQKHFVIDLIKHLNLPVILVAKSGLGTINHTLLSIEALKRRNLPLQGIILTGPINPLNRASLEKYGDVPVLAELPQLLKIDQKSLEGIPLPAPLRNLL